MRHTHLIVVGAHDLIDPADERGHFHIDTGHILAGTAEASGDLSRLVVIALDRWHHYRQHLHTKPVSS